MTRSIQTYFSSRPDPEASFQCRHIHIDGRRCGSPCLRNEPFCYFHHTTRRPAAPAELAARKGRQAQTADFVFPNPEDRSAIQLALGDVLQRIASDQIDSRRAGLLLYGLQIASLNLPKPRPNDIPDDTIEDIVEDPTLGTVAPIGRIAIPEQYKGPATRFLEKLEQEEREAAAREAAASEAQLGEAQPSGPVTIQASAAFEAVAESVSHSLSTLCPTAPAKASPFPAPPAHRPPAGSSSVASPEAQSSAPSAFAHSSFRSAPRSRRASSSRPYRRPQSHASRARTPETAARTPPSP